MTKTKKIHNMNKKHTRKNKYTKKAHKLKKRVKRTNKQFRKRFRKTRSKRQRGGNQEERDQSLFDAIGSYDYDEVENALNNGANVNAKNEDGDTPLIHAINSGDYDMVELLLEYPNINVNAKNDDGDTPLIHAIKTNNIIDDTTDDTTDDSIDDTIDDTKYYMVKSLLDHPGINVNDKNDAGDTPLICAITSNNIIYDTKYFMVKSLLDHPGIYIILDVSTNEELPVAEGEEENDQAQGGIPYLIEDYIVTKNKIKDYKYKNIKQISNYRRPNISSLSTLAHYRLPTSAVNKWNEARKDYRVPPLPGKLGGKRKTRKSKQKRRLN